MIASVPRRHRSPLHDGSLYQPKRPAFWAYVVIVVLTGIVSFGQQSFFRRSHRAGWALSWALLAVYALPVLFLVYVLDLYEREPLSLVIGALLWGAIAATTLSGFANDGWGLVVSRVGGPEFAARWTAALTAPLVEEILKGLGVVLIYLIAPDEFDDMMDGFVYGAVCGLGFAVVEDVFYFMGVFGGHPNGVLQGFFVRVVSSGLYSHVLYTGLVGMGIGYFVSRRTRRPLARRILVLRGPVGRRRARTLPVELALPRPVPRPAMERCGSGHDPRRDGGEGPSAPRVRRRSRCDWPADASARGCTASSPTRSAARHLRGRARDAREPGPATPGGPRHADARREPRRRAPPPSPARAGEPRDDPLEGRRRRRPGVDRAARVLRDRSVTRYARSRARPPPTGRLCCRRGSRRPLGFGRWTSER